MSNEVLHSLLKEYEQKKIKAELDLEKRKEALYENIPRLQKIEDDLHAFALSTAKHILKKDTVSLQELEEKVAYLKKEKLAILKEEGVDFSYLKPYYECSLCNDTGYILENNYKTRMCSCLRQRLLDISFCQSNLSSLEKENFETFNEKLFSNEVDLAKYRFNVSPRENIQHIKEKCIEFVENFDDSSAKNLLFSGNTGLR